MHEELIASYVEAITEATAELRKELDDEHHAASVAEGQRDQWQRRCEKLKSILGRVTQERDAWRAMAEELHWCMVDYSVTVDDDCPNRYRAAMAKFNALKAK